jgi:hypothetical protein
MDEVSKLKGDVLRLEARIFALQTVLALLVRKAVIEQNAQQTMLSELRIWESTPVEPQFPGADPIQVAALADEAQDAYAELIALIKDTILEG